MSTKVKKIIFTLIFIFGLSVLFYPTFSNYWNNYRQKQLISNYSQQVFDEEQVNGIDYASEWAKARAYNDSLIPMVLPDSFANAQNEKSEDRAYMKCLNLTGDGVMGTLEIPAIDITVPIMHTTDDKVLQNAAGHLEGSSLPIGGESTHSVIAAHRGLPTASLFTDLDKIGIGDHFYIHVLDETLAYEVDEIDVVEPDDTEKLNVTDGKDLCTLLTCTPYGVNTQRLLVTGHRVKYSEKEAAAESVRHPFGVSAKTNYLFWSLAGLAVVILFILFLNRRLKRQNRRPEDEKRQNGSRYPDKKQ